MKRITVEENSEYRYYKYEDMPEKVENHKITIVKECRLCKKTETRIKTNGEPLWMKDIDVKGEWTGCHLCYECTYLNDKKCFMCREEKYLLKDYDDNGYFTGRYICNKCLLSDYRNGNLDPNSTAGKGYISEVLVAKFLKIETCFDKTGIFNYRAFDIFESEDWGRINVKGSKSYNNRFFGYHEFGIRKNNVADFFFCIGYDENREHVIRVYIIPNEYYICNKDNILVPINGYSKYHKFREEEKDWDNLFHALKLENCHILRHEK